MAARAERSIAAGQYRGPLHGIPVSVKDLVDVAGTPTTSGSRVPPRLPASRRAGRRQPPARRRRHRRQDQPARVRVRHDQRRDRLRRRCGIRTTASRSAGGSSAGAAVALLEGMCYGSVGTDTGGSIRIPAAACGITGLKPTLGEISTDGVVPLSATLDHVGPMARTVEDTALMFHAMLDGEPRLDRLSAGARSAPLWLGVPVAVLLRQAGRRGRPAVRRGARRARAGGTHDRRRRDRARGAHRRRLPAHRPAGSGVVSRAAARAARRQVLARACGCGWKWGATSSRKTTCARCTRGTALRRAVDQALEGLDALLLPALPIGAPLLGAATRDDRAAPPSRCAR